MPGENGANISEGGGASGGVGVGGRQQRSGAAIFLQATQEGKAQLDRVVLADLGETFVNATVEEPGPDPEASPPPSTGRTPLMCAARLPRPSERTRLLLLLLSRGAEVDQVDGEGRTALSLASESGHLDAVRLLVGHGAQLGTTDHHGATPLTYASYRRHTPVVKFLLHELKSQGKEVVKEEEWPLGERQTLNRCTMEEKNRYHGAPGEGRVRRNLTQGQETLSWDQVQAAQSQRGDDVSGSECASAPIQPNSFPLLTNTGYFLCENTVGDLLLVDHVICNPYALEGEEEDASGVRGGGGNHRRSSCPSLSPLHHLWPQLTDGILSSGPDPSPCRLGSKKKAWGGDPAPGLGKFTDVTPRGSFLPSWLRRGHLSPAEHHSPQAHTTSKPPGGFWRWITPRRVLVSASGLDRGPWSLLTEPPETPSQSPCSGNQRRGLHLPRRPTVLRNRSFLAAGRLERSRTDECGGAGRAQPGCLPMEMLDGVIRDRDRDGNGDVDRHADEDTPSGSGCNVFRVLRRHTSPEIRAFLRDGGLDTDLEELLVRNKEDEEEDDEKDAKLR